MKNTQNTLNLEPSMDRGFMFDKWQKVTIVSDWCKEPFRQSAFPIAQRENAQRSPTTPPLFPLHSRKSILAETERYLKRVILVHRCINSRVTSTRCLRHFCVGLRSASVRAKRVPLAHSTVSQRCHRIASFLCLALTQTSGTDYFKINATMY